MTTFGKKLGAAVIALFGFIGATNATVLDTFAYGDENINQTLIVPGDDWNTPSLIQLNPVAYADYYFKLLSNPLTPLTSTTLVTTDAFDGVLSFSNDSQATSFFTITYNAGPLHPFPLDFTAGGANDAFYFDVYSSDQVFEVTVEVFSTGGGYSSIMNNAPTVSIPVGNTPDRRFVSFASFVGDADFENVEQVRVNIAAADSGDLVLAEFGIIPEPSTIAIFGLALVGLAFGARRKA